MEMLHNVKGDTFPWKFMRVKKTVIVVYQDGNRVKILISTLTLSNAKCSKTWYTCVEECDF